MGLNAVVYCDCYETGKCKMPPPFPEMVIIQEDGYVALKEPDSEVSSEEYAVWQDQFYVPHHEWKSNACEHENMIWVNYRIGNIMGVALIRSVLAKIGEIYQQQFPILQHEVVYDGVHGGDFLRPEAVRRLRTELDWIAAHDKTFRLMCN